MKKIFYRGRFVFVPVMVAAFLSLISFIVMQLWNNLLPEILQVRSITFWQAMGLFILCKILFGFGKLGGFGRGGFGMRAKMAERLEQMSPEERARFKEQFSDRMCRKRDRWGRAEWPDTDFKTEANKNAE